MEKFPLKLSELIDRGQQALKLVGDVDVVMLTDTPDGLFHSDFKPWCDLIGLEVDEYQGKEVTVFAVAWGAIDNPDEGALSPSKPEPAPKSKKSKKPDLKKVK